MSESNSTGRKDFRDIQRQFTAHLRNPTVNAPPPNIEDRRLAIYRRLVFGNLKSLLGSRFKTIKTIMGEDDWNHLIRNFLIKHRAHTPLFPELGREFVQYLEAHHDPEDAQRPFMLELAHYHWSESVLRHDEADINAIQVDKEGDLLTDIPVFSPVALVLGYQWPVHRIRPEYLPTEKPEKPTWLMVYRNAKEGISYMELTPGTARLCQILQDNQQSTGQVILEQFAAEVGRADDPQVISAGFQQLELLQQKGIILGAQAKQ